MNGLSAIFPGKQELCCTDLSFFTDLAGIGSDPLYKRYDSVNSVVKSTIPSDYQSFLAQPYYVEEEDKIHWFVNKWNEAPKPLTELEGTERERYNEIKVSTINAYKKAFLRSSGDAAIILSQIIKSIDEKYIYCYDGKVVLSVWGMRINPKIHETKGSVIYISPEAKKRYTIKFDTGAHGTFKSKLDATLSREDGRVLGKEDLPLVIPSQGYEFKEWQPSPYGYTVHGDSTFKAIYNKLAVEPDIEDSQSVPPVPPAPPKVNNRKYIFDSGVNGKLCGATEFEKPEGYVLSKSDYPKVIPNNGYKFDKWAVENTSGESRYTATYAQLPWYRRFWLWLTAMDWRGCLKWLLLALLILLLLLFLLKSCRSCSHHAENGIVPIDSVEVDNGKFLDDNGHAHDIIASDGTLPDSNVIAPIVGEDGNMPPIEKNPGAPDIIANRLNIYFENDNADLDRFAKEFKNAYPQKDFAIIGCDRQVKMVQIQVPENLRNQVREEIASKVPSQKFFVVDESIFQLNGYLRDDGSNPGWHLKAINVQGGWRYSKGSSNVTVAVIDDGIDYSHPMFTGRIVSPYNVFTQTNTLSRGEGHGTHVAGLAVGSSQYYSKGVSGVAPSCKLMPVQVFDNKVATFSSITSGIMYAIHNNADVINVSIGPELEGLNALPVNQQERIADTQFKNEEWVWKKIITVANRKNSILVFAAGNNDVITRILPECRTNQTINVAAVNKSIKGTQFTNYGSGSNISAPGEDILSSFPIKTFRYCDGTSMAAPIVSGTIALMKSLDKNINVSQVLGVLQHSGKAVGNGIPPMVQIPQALAMVKSGKFPAPVSTISDSRGVGPSVGSSSEAKIDVGGIVGDEISKGSSPTAPDQGTDYDEIRRLIQVYKDKIKELEKQLPNGK